MNSHPLQALRTNAPVNLGPNRSLVDTPYIDYARSIPLRAPVDVFVAGGGPAGVAAAVVAARAGAKVLLVDSQICLGGTGTAAGLPMFCAHGDGVHLTSSGFGTDVYERMYAADALAPPYRGRELLHNFLAYNPEVLKKVYDDMAVEAGVQLSFGTSLIDVIPSRAPGEISAAVCSAKGGLFAIEARIFVDATGDGDLCALGGAPFEKGDSLGNMQPGTLLSQWCGIDWETADASGCGVWTAEKHIEEAIAEGMFTTPDRHLPGIIPTGEHTGWGNVGHLFGIDGTDERSITEKVLHGRRLFAEYRRYFQKYYKGFEKLELIGSGAMAGVRESRRILGDYILNVEDFRRKAVFDDEIGRFSYPVDLHATTPDPKNQAQVLKDFKTLRYKPGENYGIPYRVLLPQRLQNVLVAGRCVSCDRAMQASLRVMPGCYITGQAAGMAAALCARAGTRPRLLDIRQLQRALLLMGAYLPNA